MVDFRVLLKAEADREPARVPAFRVRTIIGGAPVSAGYAREIGADGYACDAAAAVERVRSLLEVV